jgi:hypothetical protein
MACAALLSKNLRDRLRKGGPPVATVDPYRFQELHFDGRSLILDWAGRAVAQTECADRDSFEPFIFGWIALNGWATCVTGEDLDFQYLDALISDSNLAREFNERLSAGLFDAAREFQSLWPIFCSKDIGYNADPSGDRQQLIRRYRKINPSPGFRPECTFEHLDRGEEVPLDWPHTLSAIYRVRSNLFHGYKGVHSENDVLIVSRAFRVLVRLLPMLIPTLRLPSVEGTRSAG